MATRMKLVGAVAMMLLAVVLATPQASGQTPDRTTVLRGVWGTYDNAPRGTDGRVNQERLLAELVELRANTYHWLIWHAATDWEDLQQFLPRAREKQIKVWVTLVPPSESPPHAKNYSEPFQLDYCRWAEELAKLSVREPNLVAWSVDDFTHNLAFFTPEKMREIRETAQAINPRLAFVPCSYFPAVTKQFAERYAGLFDGLLFPYRYESVKANLTDASLVEKEVAQLRAIVGPQVPIILDVYASGHSRLGNSTPEYVEQVMASGKKAADGVLIYCHQSPKTPKYQVLKRQFHAWAEEQ